MAAAFILKPFLLVLCSILIIKTTRAFNSSSRSSFNTTTTATASLDSHLSYIRSVCKSTPYPDVCFDSLKLSISINISPSILTYLLQSLQNALSEGGKLSNLFSTTSAGTNIIEKQRGTIQDCKDLHQVTMSYLKRSVSTIRGSSSSPDQNHRKMEDAKAFLTALLTNKNTCLEGLDSASGPLKPILVNSMITTYKHVSNSLSVLSKTTKGTGTSKGDQYGNRRRRLMANMGPPGPKWLSQKDRRILQDEYDPKEVIWVAADGTGNFTTVSDAINFAPNNSYDRTIIYVRQGVYEENVEIPSYKTNVVMIGDGSDATVITSNRSVVDGWTTFRSATVAVSGEGFLARDITFENSAGPGKHQAVALRINADFAAVYRCTINGYQDTLYVHSFRQFYRECNISGTIDFIFGNAAVVFQACSIISRMPIPGQFTVITAQSRESPDQDSGISIQNCSIVATDELYSNFGKVKSYFGRPWRLYSRTVYIESFMDDFIDPAGWTEWSGNQGLDTLYYGEYDNTGPGSETQNRVTWPGYHIMDYYDASNFTVSVFITGDEWLDSTSFPYDEGI